MSGPHLAVGMNPPIGGPLIRLVIYGIYRSFHIQLPSLPAARRGPPQAPAL